MTEKKDKQNPNQHTRRIEYRLHHNNTPYLHLDNLKGSVDDVQKRYTPLIGNIHHNYFYGNVEVTGTYNKKFNKILEIAEDGEHKNRRYRDGKLKKSKPIPPCPTKAESEKKKQVQKELKSTFFKEVKEAKKCVKMVNRQIEQ